MGQIRNLFGDVFKSKETRVLSYDFLENFVGQSHDWSMRKTPDSDSLVLSLNSKLRSLDDNSFAFLLCHTGYIPEQYEHDSSEETIYTKLIEAIVQEWAFRMGFDQTVLPKQKSSKEDITIQDEESLIVCDAKSFRLGRSQKAPNVKDALKEGDISKWLQAHSSSPRKGLGGLVTFPSQHDWSAGSDFYFYLTNKNLPIVCLFYEHLAYMLFSQIQKESLISLYRSYPVVFSNQLKKTQRNRTIYWENVEKHLFDDIDSWRQFKFTAQLIIQEKAFHTISGVNQHLITKRQELAKALPSDLNISQLKEMLVDAQFNNATAPIQRQLNCIKEFREYTDDYIQED